MPKLGTQRAFFSTRAGSTFGQTFTDFARYVCVCVRALVHWAHNSDVFDDFFRPNLLKRFTNAADRAFEGE